MTNKQCISYIRSIAKHNGLTFKQQANLRINGAVAWKFTDRKSGETVMKNCTLVSALESVESGYIASYNQKIGYFHGINNN